MVHERLRKFRQLKGFTLDQLSERSGVDRGTIHRIELDQVSPRLDTLERLCQALGLDLPAFFGAEPPSEEDCRLHRLEAQLLLLRGLTARFGNLLMAIQGHLDLLDPGASGSPRLAGLQQALDQASRALAQMRDAGGNPPLVRQPLDLARFLESRRDHVEGHLGAGQSLQLQLPPDPLPIEGDPDQLTRLLEHLTAHAATGLGPGTLQIGLRRTDPGALDPASFPSGPVPACATLEVTHSGTPAHRDGPLPPFDLSRHLATGSWDFALPAIHRIVLDHAGSFEAVGSQEAFTLRIHLPTSDRTVPPPAPEVRPGRPATATILLVEDETEVRQAATLLLEWLGCTVLPAVDGVEGLRQYRTHRDRIDLVLLDLQMPNLDGAATLEALIALDPRVRVALCTGSTLPAPLAQHPPRNLLAVLQKPYRAAELEGLLRSVLGDRA